MHQLATQDRMLALREPTAFKSVSSHREEQLTSANAGAGQRTGRDRTDGFQLKGAAIGARSADTGTRNGWREGIMRTRAEEVAPGRRLATPEAQSCQDRAPVRQASSKRLRSMGTAEPQPPTSMRSRDKIIS